MASLATSTLTILSVSTTSKISNRDTQCGIGSCRPWWLQKLANRNVFVLVFACMEIMQATFYSYFRSVITTLEKQFSVQSQTIGLVLSGKEISQVLCGMLLAYYGSRGNRPRWIAAGLLITSFACLVMVSPIFLYFDKRVVVADNEDSEIRQSLCQSEDGLAAVSSAVWTNNSGIHNASTMTGYCDPDLKSDTVTALVLLFIGGFIAGVGITLIVTLTYPYLDDNVSKSASALYISIMTALQVMGPTVGSMLGGLCLRFYVTLANNPGITADDPKWIGAWWLGFIIIAATFGAGALIIICFPQQLERNSKNEIVQVTQEAITDNSATEKDAAPKSSGLPSTLKRLLRNKILVCHAVARCFNLFGTNGFDTFQPKYIESHFRQTASEASFFTGISGNAMRIVGILIVGLVLRFWKPKAIFLTAWNILMDFMYIGSLIALMLLSCPTVEIVGFNTQSWNDTTGIQVIEQSVSCDGSCSCPNVGFSPICLENQNYFSPCHAGCQNYEGIKRKSRRYFNCSCANFDENGDDYRIAFNQSLNKFLNSKYSSENAKKEPPIAKSGYCPYSCSSFTIYLIVMGVMRTLIATKKVSRMLIILRCIDAKDKSLGIAFHTMMESLFAYIPCPIVYGALLDAACIMWGTNCGERANCWLYDSDYLRYVMQGLTLLVIICGTMLDAYVLYLCRSLPLFDKPVDGADSNTQISPEALENGCEKDENKDIKKGGAAPQNNNVDKSR